MYSWAEMRRWCPQLGHTFSARTNRSLMSMCPHSSHFSQASAGISCLPRSDVSGLSCFFRQVIVTTVEELTEAVWGSVVYCWRGGCVTFSECVVYVFYQGSK